MANRSNTPLVDEVPALMAERGLSISALARAVGVTQPHLSRVLGRKKYQTPSADLAANIARELGLPPDYWPEYRTAKVVARVRSDDDYRDTLYDELPPELR